jgi:glycine/serine hydroxymethyltransferase
MTSNHHLGTLVGLLLAAIEMNTFKDAYQRQVIANAKAFARALKDAGLDVQGDPACDYTETHQVVVRVGYGRGCEVAQRLEDSNIICNYQALPGDDGFSASSGLRLGVAEMTRFGMAEQDFARVAELMAEAIVRERGVADEVESVRASFQEMRYCFEAGELGASVHDVLAILF